MAILISQVIILCAVFLYFVGMGLGMFTGAPYIGTSPNVVSGMLEMANIGKEDTVIDLGCGLGNILFQALEEKSVRRVIGYDMNPLLILACRLRSRSFKSRSSFYAKSIANMESHPDVTVITLYLLPHLMNKIAPVLAKSLPSTARIIAHGFEFNDIEPIKIQTVDGATLRLYAMSDLIAAHTI